MELITFDKTTKKPPVIHSKIPFITINSSGKLNFSQAAYRLMSLSEGDRLILHQDSTYRSDWYIEITKEERGYAIAMEKTASRVTCAHAVRQIFLSIGRKERKISFQIKNKPFIQNGIQLWIIDFKNELK